MEHTPPLWLLVRALLGVRPGAWEVTAAAGSYTWSPCGEGRAPGGARAELLREEEGPALPQQRRGAGRQGGQAPSFGAMMKVEAGFQPHLREPLTETPPRVR